MSASGKSLLRYALSVIVLASVLLVARAMLDRHADTPVAAAPDTVTRAPVTQAPAVAETPAAKTPATFHTGLENLPRALQGTQVDGRLQADADGHLKITLGVRHVFDYFLSMIGQEPLATIKARILAYIHSQLPEPAASEAEHILDGYIAYKTALADLKPASGEPHGSMDIIALRQQLDAKAGLRQQYLDPDVIQAFFGDQDAYDRYTLDRLAVMQNSALTAEEKSQRLAELKQSLPESTQQSMDAVTEYQDLQQATQQCQQEGCSAAQLHQVRVNVVGEAAANRLDQLDQQNAAWDNKLSNWLSQRDAILNNSGLSAADQQQQIAQLRDSLFQGGDRTRVIALEKLHDSGQPVPGLH